jgi:uncharacterized membrane protein YgcG
MKLLSTAIFLFCFFLSGYLHAQYPSVFDVNDRILKYHSDITVQNDGDLLVKEFITVYNGQYGNIERGIFRDFPTLYKDTSGFWDERGFSVKNVYRDQAKEPFHKENISNGVRLLIGDKDVFLSSGIFTYTIEYETTRQIIFAADRDELYWNVNGNGWIFTTDTVSCTIHFPASAIIKAARCYTGPFGDTSSDCKSKQSAPNEISFVNTNRFESYEGMTVAVGIEKGIITPPSSFQNFKAFIKGNYIIPLLLFIFLFFISYYCYVWYTRGRDPRRGVVFPQFSPPPGIDPAEAGYILDQKYGSHLFAAMLINCAVKKQLNIEVTREGLLFKSNVYTFTKPAEASGTNGEFGFDLNRLYGQRAEKGKYNSILRTCYTSLQDGLKDKFLIRRGKKNKEEGLFTLNRGYVIFATILLIASIVAAIKFLTERPSLKIGIFCVVVVLLILITHVIFKRIMSAYTKKGRMIVDHLLGFKMYLAQAEQHIYNQLAPPEKTLDLFEKYLPYAVALRVENEWAEKFDSIMETAMASGYQPSYYSFAGHSGSFHINDFSRGISSGLSSTISSASTPPSSSSSGSGSSGGGGGGGGGGGW